MYPWLLAATGYGAIPQTIIRGLVGRAVTLPCFYSVSQRDGLHHMCWGRDSCPESKCDREILRTNGRRITSKTSQRYQLNGYVTRGDASLTIVELSERDEGLYCCRIELPGWLNDLKKTFNQRPPSGDPFCSGNFHGHRDGKKG
uniref:Ig-like domain-containing protein n=1 Tax=Salvator merianae TaxID=96440 RepID=A0A8D0DWI4_SALMN